MRQDSAESRALLLCPAGAGDAEGWEGGRPGSGKGRGVADAKELGPRGGEGPVLWAHRDTRPPGLPPLPGTV